MPAASFEAGWIRCAERAARLGVALLAVALAPLTAAAQDLPRLRVTALGMHADRRVVRTGEAFHVLIHVHVREQRDRLDELVLPALTNAIDLGDERRRVPAADGTDFYETLTVESDTVGTASFSPAYIDAIDPAVGRGMRYSSQPVSVRVVAPAGTPATDPDALGRLLRRAALGALAVVVLLGVAGFALVRLRRGPRPSRPPPAVAVPSAAAPADALRAALAAYRLRGDDATLDVLRSVLFTRAGAGAGATFADALRALGSSDPQLARALAVAERARFGPAHERAPAARDLLVLLDAYLSDREPVA